ncbi:uncharacterized protein LOC143297858 [Babylonia areolata]|uniref:uncharacterized protein LOC143297858 n=1 Tax=Babylonia areolata TaxID=304850 RepID=UPI003FD55208
MEEVSQFPPATAVQQIPPPETEQTPPPPPPPMEAQFLHPLLMPSETTRVIPVAEQKPPRMIRGGGPRRKLKPLFDEVAAKKPAVDAQPISPYNQWATAVFLFLYFLAVLLIVFYFLLC